MFHGLVGATQSDLYTASLGTYKRIFMVDAQPSLLASLMKKWGVSSHICDFTKFKNQYFIICLVVQKLYIKKKKKKKKING